MKSHQSPTNGILVGWLVVWLGSKSERSLGESHKSPTSKLRSGRGAIFTNRLLLCHVCAHEHIIQLVMTGIPFFGVSWLWSDEVPTNFVGVPKCRSLDFWGFCPTNFASCCWSKRQLPLSRLDKKNSPSRVALAANIRWKPPKSDDRHSGWVAKQMNIRWAKVTKVQRISYTRAVVKFLPINCCFAVLNLVLTGIPWYL